MGLVRPVDYGTLEFSFLELLVSVLFSKNYNCLIQQTCKLEVIIFFFLLIFNLENSNKSSRNVIVE